MDLDPKTMKILRSVYPDLKTRIILTFNDVSETVGLPMKVTSGFRSISEQKTIWGVGRDEDGNVIDPKKILTKSPPGSSFHNYGLAVDSCFSGPDPYLERVPSAIRDDHWRRYGMFVSAHGLVWGYDWNGNGKVDANDFDRPHAQITYGLTLKEIQGLYKTGGLVAVWSKVDQIRGVRIGSEWKIENDLPVAI